MPLRLFDVHCNWLRQYALETTTFQSSAYVDVSGRLKQLDGYMTATSAAVLSCDRSPADWDLQPDPWRALGELVALTRPSSPAACSTAGPISNAGAGAARRTDLGRPRHLRPRPPRPRSGRPGSPAPRSSSGESRVLQLVESARSVLAGSAEPGDDRGLSELGRASLAAIAGHGGALGGRHGSPQPALDGRGVERRGERRARSPAVSHVQPRHGRPSGVRCTARSLTGTWCD